MCLRSGRCPTPAGRRRRHWRHRGLDAGWLHRWRCRGGHPSPAANWRGRVLILGGRNDLTLDGSSGRRRSGPSGCGRRGRSGRRGGGRSGGSGGGRSGGSGGGRNELRPSRPGAGEICPLSLWERAGVRARLGVTMRGRRWRRGLADRAISSDGQAPARLPGSGRRRGRSVRSGLCLPTRHPTSRRIRRRPRGGGQSRPVNAWRRSRGRQHGIWSAEASIDRAGASRAVRPARPNWSLLRSIAGRSRRERLPGIAAGGQRRRLERLERLEGGPDWTARRLVGRHEHPGWGSRRPRFDGPCCAGGNVAGLIGADSPASSPDAASASISSRAIRRAASATAASPGSGRP